MRIPISHALWAATVLAMLLPGAAQAALGPQAGVTAAVRGKVLLAEVGRPEAGATAVNDGSEVFLGNAIRSGDASGLQLMLLDQTSVTLGENAEMAVDDFVYDPNSDVARLAVGISRGTFRLVTGAISDIDPANTVIRTPTAVIGVRGTILLTRVTPAGSLIALGGPGKETDTRDRVGAVEVTTPQGSVVLTRPGFATFVAPGKAPEAPRPLTDEESASLNGDLSKKAGQGMNMAFNKPATGDAGGASRAAGGRVGSLNDPCDPEMCQRRMPTSGPSNVNPNSVTPDNGETNPWALDPTLPWSAPNGGSEITNNQIVGRQNLVWPTGAADLSGLGGAAQYTATGIPIYKASPGAIQEVDGSTNGLDRWGYFEGSFRDVGVPGVGTYDFQASVDFDARKLVARFYNGRLYDKIILPELGTLTADFPIAGELAFRSSALDVPNTTAKVFLAARLMTSRELDPARVLEQSLVLKQGGSYYGNTSNIYGTATGWAAPNFSEFTSTATGASWFSGQASYDLAGVKLFSKALDGTFTVPSGQYDVAATVDFDTREVRETISNMTIAGQAGTFDLPAILHAIVSGTKLDYRDTGLDVRDAGIGTPVPGLSATVGTRFVTDWNVLYDKVEYLRHTLSMSEGGQPTFEGAARILGDMSLATDNNE